MRHFHKVSLFLITVSLPLAAAEPVNWRFWDAGDGMVESYVSSLAASPDGTLVLRHGAVESMDVLDGYRMKAMQDPKSLGRIYRDDTGIFYGFDATGLRIRREKAWATTPVAGFFGFPLFSQFQTFRSFLYSADEGMEVQHRLGILPVGAGELLVMFPDRLEKWRTAGEKAELAGVVKVADRTALGEFIDLEPDGPEAAWIAGTRGVGRLSREGAGWNWTEWAGQAGLTRFTYPSLTQTGSVLATARGADGKTRVVEERDHHWEVKYTGLHRRVRSWPHDNQIWIKDGDQLFTVQEDRAVPAAREPRLSGVVSDVLPQPDGVFWLSTSQVLARYAPALWQTPSGEARGIDETVNSIAEDVQGRVWFSAGQRLLRFGTDGWRTLTLPDRQDTVATKSICPLPDGRVIVASSNRDRLWSVNTESLDATEIRHPEGRKFGWIQPRDGNTLWVQTRVAGEKTSRLEIFDGKNFTPFAGLNGIPILDLRGVLQARDGAIWAGGVEGLVVLRNGKLTVLPKQEGLGENDGFALFEARDGSILIGHRDALTVYDGKKFHTVRNGMNRARSMLQTQDGTVWIASGSGVHRLRADGWITNSTDEGLPSPAAYTLFQDRSGRMWTGTTLGISLFHPEADRDPPVTGIREERNVHQVSPEGNVRFSFWGRDRWKVTPDDRLLFSWRVDGKAWNRFAEEPYASLNSLRAGTHVFEVRSMDRNGNFDPRPASFTFSVAPPWYRETGFDVMAVFAALALFGVARFALNYHSSLRFQIRHDPLTGLLNRAAFEEELEKAVAKFHRGDIATALMLLDLDGFKKVNDIYGHQCGDALLQSVSRRIHGCLRENDTLARLGGDEFGIVLAPGTTRENVISVADRLLDSVRGISEIQGHPVTLSASIGISLFPDHAETATAVFRLADLAMYQSKARNKDCYVFFDPDTPNVNFSASDIAGKLRTALARDDFRLFFQPIIDRSGRVVQLEALARIQDHETGLILPEVFIKVAEDTNLICEVGLWVIVNACRQLREWRDAGLDVTVALNVSPLQLENEGFPGSILNAISTHGLQPDTIAVEVTEQTLIRNKDRVRRALEQLRAAGVRVSLDDFGSGYSSLEAMTTLPVDTIKIDRSLVHAINATEGMREVAREIVIAAHRAGMKVTAEGIEKVTQLQCLVELNCDFFQGFYLSVPLDAEAAREFVSRGVSALV